MNSPEEMRKWYKEAGFGMMVHFGLYSLLMGEWLGQRITAPYAEWVMANRRIPISEYEKLARAFDPVFFDADRWIAMAADAGMKYFVITAKHHDGFALYHSKCDPYNVVDATPFGRDIVGELADACARHGLKLGLYYSQDLDWHERHGGGYRSNQIRCCGVSWDNSWDFPDEQSKNYDICFEKKIYPQVEEILTGYGELCLVWFDVPMTIRDDQSRQLYQLVKKYQPSCLINSRLGNGAYDYVSLGDNEIPDALPEAGAGTVADMNDIFGFKPSPWGLYETAATMNDSWGYCAFDQNFKSPQEIRGCREKLKKLGINYLLNVGPDPLGRFPAKSVEILQALR